MQEISHIIETCNVARNFNQYRKNHSGLYGFVANYPYFDIWLMWFERHGCTLDTAQANIFEKPNRPIQYNNQFGG